MFITGLGDIPMVPYGALDSGSLMRQISNPRIHRGYDSRSIGSMPMGIAGMGMGIPSGMGGYLGAAGVGLAAGALLSQSGGLQGLGSSLGFGGQQQQPQQQYVGQQNYMTQQNNGGQLPDRSGGMYGQQQGQNQSYMNQPPYNQQNQQGQNQSYMNQPPYNQQYRQGQNQSYMNQPPYNQQYRQGQNQSYMNQPPYNQQGQNGQPQYNQPNQGMGGVMGGTTQPAFSSMGQGAPAQNNGFGGNTQQAYNSGTQPQQSGGMFGQNGSFDFGASVLSQNGRGFNPDSPFNLSPPQPNYSQVQQQQPLPQSSAPTSFNPNAGIQNSQPAQQAPLPRSNAPTSFNPNAGMQNNQSAPQAPLPQSSAPTSFNPNAGIQNNQPVQQAPLPQSSAPTSFNPNAGIQNNQTAQQAPLPQSSAPTSFNPNAGIQNSQPAQQAPLPRSNAPTSFNPNPAASAPSAPAEPAPRPKIKRRRAPAEGKAIVKGQKVGLEAPGEAPLSKIKIALGWETSNDRCDLDASAFLLGAGDKVPSDDWFIFYGQPQSPDRSVSYKVFDEDPSNCDDAAIEIDLSRVDPKVEKIAVAVTIYEAFEKKLNFGMVPTVYARIINCATGREIIRFELSDRNSAVTALVAGELYRYKGTWKWNAVGSGVNRDLAGFCGMYGVNLE